MCGIAGALSPISAERDAAVGRAAVALGHRGPDGTASHLAPTVALAHTRLAIIDRTARSDQPMVDPETGSVLVFNGEIYNYRELRTELQSAGLTFRSDGDTEVLLLAYRHWGRSCLEHLNGMFAFALWDADQQHLFIARDRFGEKPLVLAWRGRELWFASEVKALVAAGVVTPAADREMLYRFLAFGDLGHPTGTVFEGVTSLAPAHCAWVAPGEPVRSNAYWEVPGTPAHAPYRTDAFEEVEALWTDSIRLRLRSDVPVGTSLSGGPDSSAVIATVRKLRGDGELHAFTASFPGTDADELHHARAVADRVGATLHPIPLGPDDLLADLDAVMWANESPVEASSQFAQYRVMREAHDAGVVVLLDGQGADEVFGGYDKYAGAVALDQALTGKLGLAARSEQDWRTVHGRFIVPPVGRYLGALPGPKRLMASGRVAASGRWLAPAVRSAAGRLDPVAGDPHPTARPGQVAAAIMRQDLTRWTLPRLLHYGDRNSMAWSREIRLPFLDHRLVELAASLPADQRIAGGWTKTPIRHLLRRLDLPEIADRRDKKAYMPPQQSWLSHPELDRRVRDAWRELHRAGLLATPEPDGAPLHRWRVLSTHAWAERFAITLDV